MSSALNSTLADLAGLLDAQKIAFAVVGGIAVTLRSEPRFTADVDVVIAVDIDRAVLLIDQLDASLFEPLVADPRDLVRTAMLLPLRHCDSDITVDVAIGLSGFERLLIDRATLMQVGLINVPVATAEDLILMKLLAGRPRDQDDIASIVDRLGEVMDWSYLMDTGQQLQQAVDIDLVPQISRLQARFDDNESAD